VGFAQGVLLETVFIPTLFLADLTPPSKTLEAFLDVGRRDKKKSNLVSR